MKLTPLDFFIITRRENEWEDHRLSKIEWQSISVTRLLLITCKVDEVAKSWARESLSFNFEVTEQKEAWNIISRERDDKRTQEVSQEKTERTKDRYSLSNTFCSSPCLFFSTVWEIPFKSLFSSRESREKSFHFSLFVGTSWKTTLVSFVKTLMMKAKN